MIESPNEWITAAERVTRKALPWGVVALILSGLVALAFNVGLIPKDAFGGNAYSVTWIVLVVATGLLTIGLVSWIAQVFVWVIKLPFTWFADARSSSGDRQHTIENIRMLSSKDRLLLLAFSKNPSGRFLSPGDSDTMTNLMTSGLIESEHLSLIGGTYTGQHMKVNRLVLHKQVRRELESLVEQAYPGTTTTREVLLERVQAVHQLTRKR